jgi:type VI protein secretion system component VasK
MMKIYLMLSYVGWVWTMIFALALAIAVWWHRRVAATRGFEVVEPNEKQH